MSVDVVPSFDWPTIAPPRRVTNHSTSIRSMPLERAIDRGPRAGVQRCGPPVDGVGWAHLRWLIPSTPAVANPGPSKPATLPSATQQKSHRASFFPEHPGRYRQSSPCSAVVHTNDPQDLFQGGIASPDSRPAGLRQGAHAVLDRTAGQRPGGFPLNDQIVHFFVGP